MGNDFFKKQEEPEEVKEEVQEENSKIKVGEDEYSQDELNDLVNLGKLGREAEEKFNTKLDRVWPEYGKSQNKVKELESKLEELEQRVQAPVQQQSDLTPEAISQAKEAARKIGIVTEDQFDKYLDLRFRTRYLQERAAEKLLEDCDKMEGEIDGKDGRPSFNKDRILRHMVETGIKNPRRAYKDLYEKELDEWKEKNLQAMKPATYMTQTEAPSMKAPTEQKVNDQNLRAALEEALYRKPM